MLDEHARQPNRLVAQLAPNHAVWLRGAVSLAEEQIEHLEDARNALFELGQRRHVELGATFTQTRARTLQTLVDRVGTLKEAQRDLVRAESAQRLQRQRELRVVRDPGIGAEEEHSQEIVLELRRQDHRVSRWIFAPLSVFDRARRMTSLCAYGVDDVVMRDAIQPGAGLIGHAGARPRLDRPKQRSLCCIFTKLDGLCTEPSGEDGDQTPVLVSEIMLR